MCEAPIVSRPWSGVGLHESREDDKMKIQQEPTTLGEILSEEVLKPRAISQADLAIRLGSARRSG